MKYAVIAATVGLFIAALVGMQFVQQQFFPSSDRPELLVDLTLAARRLRSTRPAKWSTSSRRVLKTDPDIERWSFYIGSGAIRFYLPLDQQLANDFFAQAVVVTKDFKVRVRRAATHPCRAATAGIRAGAGARQPPRAWTPSRLAAEVPRQRTGSDESARAGPRASRRCSATTPNARNINFDWNEPSKVVRVEVDQDRARALGISSQALSQTINAVLSGTSVTQLRDSIYLVDIVARAIPRSAPSSKPCAA